MEFEGNVLGSHRIDERVDSFGVSDQRVGELGVVLNALPVALGCPGQAQPPGLPIDLEQTLAHELGQRAGRRPRLELELKQTVPRDHVAERPI